MCLALLPPLNTYNMPRWACCTHLAYLHTNPFLQTHKTCLPGHVCVQRVSTPTPPLKHIKCAQAPFLCLVLLPPASNGPNPLRQIKYAQTDVFLPVWHTRHLLSPNPALFQSHRMSPLLFHSNGLYFIPSPFSSFMFFAFPFLVICFSKYL